MKKIPTMKNLRINEFNKSFKLIKNNVSPNFQLIDISTGSSINIDQIRDLIKNINKSSLIINQILF